MRSWTRLLLCCLTLTVGAACGDTPTSPAAPPAPPAADLVPVTSPLDAQVRGTIDALFPRLLADVIGATWKVIVAELVISQKPGLTDQQRALAVDIARRQLVGLVAFIQSKTGKIIAPAGETQDHAAARLVLLMSLYVYNGPATTPPVIPPSSDAVVAIVQPSATTTQTVRTPTQHAAVQFPPGSLGETRIIVISQLMTPYPVNCSGPLQTVLCQYPQFYTFSSFPDTRLQSPAIAAVCHINAGDSRTPLEDHDGFRIAHDRPADPANYVDGGTVREGIEVLPFVLVSGLTSCPGNSYFGGGSQVGSTGALGRALRWLGDPAARFASAVFERIAPRKALAIDGIGGGEFNVFSNFGVVDPAGLPDLSVGFAPPGHEGAYSPGDIVQLGSWSVSNIGTATARAPVANFYLESVGEPTGQLILRVPAVNASNLAPGQSLGGSPASLNLPLDLPNGFYDVSLGVVDNDVDGLGESNYDNNRLTVRIEVFTPVIGQAAPAARSPFAFASFSAPSRAGRLTREARGR